MHYVHTCNDNSNRDMDISKTRIPISSFIPHIIAGIPRSRPRANQGPRHKEQTLGVPLKLSRGRRRWEGLVREDLPTSLPPSQITSGAKAFCWVGSRPKMTCCAVCVGWACVSLEEEEWRVKWKYKKEKEVKEEEEEDQKTRFKSQGWKKKTS